MTSLDLCDGGSSSTQGKNNGALKDLVVQVANQNIATAEGEECITIEPDNSVMDADEIVWLKMCRVQLSEADRKILLTFGCQLNDKHVNLAQKLLQNQFPSMKVLHQHLRVVKAKLNLV